MALKPYYADMEEPKDKNDICIAPDCNRRHKIEAVHFHSLIPLFSNVWPFKQKGLICAWCGTVYERNENEEPNNPRRS